MRRRNRSSSTPPTPPRKALSPVPTGLRSDTPPAAAAAIPVEPPTVDDGVDDPWDLDAYARTDPAPHPGLAEELDVDLGTGVTPGWVKDAVSIEPTPTPTSDGGRRLVAGAGFVPAGDSRRAGRAARREAAARARAVEEEAREGAAAARAADREARRAAEDRRDYLPASGERGPDALRQYRRLRLPAHKATSEVLAGAYPFLAEAGLGSEGVYVGMDSYSSSAFCYDPWVLYQRKLITNPNVLVAGSIGSGKSTVAKSMATRSIAFGRKVYVPGDPKGEWTAVAEQVGGQAIVLGGGSSARLNPLDEGPRTARTIGADGRLVAMSDERWAAVVASRRRELLHALASAAMNRPLHATEATALYAALATAQAANTTVILPQVIDAMHAPSAAVDGSSKEQLLEDGRAVAHALRNKLLEGVLAGVFDGPSTRTFDPSAPMVSLDLSQIQASDDAIAVVQTCAAAWMESAFSDPDGGQRWVIYDEAWRLFRFPAMLARMQSQWKLSRALGIANMAIMHRLSDLDAVGDEGSEARNLALGLLADCSTRVIYAHEPGEADKTGTRIGLTTSEIAQLQHLDQGEGLWKIRDRSFMVRNLLTPGELAVFSTDARMGGAA